MLIKFINLRQFDLNNILSSSDNSTNSNILFIALEENKLNQPNKRKKTKRTQ